MSILLGSTGYENMLDKKQTKDKHLTDFDRTFVEDALSNEFTLTKIGKDPSTISKEVKKNRIIKESKTKFKGGCIKRSTCRVKHFCCHTYNKLCKSCINLNCMKTCGKF